MLSKPPIMLYEKPRMRCTTTGERNGPRQGLFEVSHGIAQSHCPWPVILHLLPFILHLTAGNGCRSIATGSGSKFFHLSYFIYAYSLDLLATASDSLSFYNTNTNTTRYT